jgi:hypothetical protein
VNNGFTIQVAAVARPSQEVIETQCASATAPRMTSRVELELATEPVAEVRAPPEKEVPIY